MIALLTVLSVVGCYGVELAKVELTEEWVKKQAQEWATFDLTNAYSSDAQICGHGFCLNGIDEINQWIKGFESAYNMVHVDMFDIDIDKQTNSFYGQYIYYFNIKGDGCDDNERSFIHKGRAIGHFNEYGLVRQQNFHSNFQELITIIDKCNQTIKQDL